MMIIIMIIMTIMIIIVMIIRLGHIPAKNAQMRVFAHLRHARAIGAAQRKIGDETALICALRIAKMRRQKAQKASTSKGTQAQKRAKGQIQTIFIGLKLAQLESPHHTAAESRA